MPTFVRHLKSACVATLFLLGCRAWATLPGELPHVVVMRPDASIIESLEKNHLVPMRLEASPELREFADRMGALLQKRLVRPEDGPGRLHLIFVDDASVNAGFVRLPSGSRYITVHRGLLQFVQNDDELAYILGHELEHGVSQLQTEINAIHTVRETPPDRLARDAVLSRLLQRQVEAEVDVKAVLKRMVESEFNPYAAIHVLDRVESMQGGLSQVISNTHSLTSSRRDLIGLALTAFKRQGGKQVKPDLGSDYSRSVLGPLQDRYLNTPEFQQKQVEKLESVLRRPDTVPTELYQAALEGRSPAEGYQQVFARRWEEASAYLPDITDRRANIDWKLKLHRELQARFDEARAVAMKKLAQYSATVSLVDLERLDHRYYSLDLPSISGTRDALVSARAKLQGLDHQLASAVLSQDRREELTSLKKTQTQLLKQVQEQYELALYPYRDRELVDRLDGGHQSLEAHLREIGPFVEENRQRSQQLVRSQLHRSLLSQQGWDSLLKQLSLVEVLPDGEQSKFLPQVFKSVGEAAGTLSPDVLRRDWKNSDVLKRLLSHYFRTDPSSAVQTFRPHFLKMLESGDPLDWVQSGYPMGGAVFESTVYNEPFLFHSDFLKQLMDQETVNQFVKKAQQSSRSEFARHAEVSDYLLAAFRKKNDALNQLVQRGILTAAQSRAIALPDQLNDFLMSRSWGKNGLTPEQDRSLFFVREPEIYSILPAENKPTVSEIRRDLLQVASSNYGKSGSVRRLDYRKLKHFSGPTDADFFEWVTSTKDLLEFGSTADVSGAEGVERAKFLGRYAQWLRENKPELVDLRATISAPLKNNLIFLEDGQQALEVHQKESARFLEERFRKHMALNAGLSVRKQSEETAYQLMQELKSWPEGIKTVTHGWLPSEPTKAAEFYLGFVAGVKRAHRFDTRYRVETFVSWRETLPWISELAQKDPELLGELYFSVLEMSGTLSQKPLKHPGVSLSYGETDEIFEAFWAATEGRPELRQKFLEPHLVGLLHFDQNKQRLARWQLEQKFKLSAFGKAYRTDRRVLPGEYRVRPLIKQIRKFLDQQFEQGSGTKGEIANWAQETLLTNAEETRFLDDLKIGVGNWQKIRAVAALDLPHILSQRLPSQRDRTMLLEYLIGSSKEMPRFVRDHEVPSIQQEEQKALLRARRHFQEGDLRLRTYLLQPLLDAKTGILSDPIETERIYRLILGDQVQDPLIRKIFLSYLEAVPESERKVILGHILAKAADRPGVKTSVKTLLEAMGPMGIRSGQFIRASGLASSELLAELDDFFDQAMRPDRTIVFSQLEKVFGKKLQAIQNVRQVIGAGSINYVVLADMKNPKTDKVERVVLRVLRDAVEGQLANENAVWEAVIEKLKADPSVKIKKFGQFAAEVREHAYSTLKPGGIELDQTLERSSYEKARQVYERPGIKGDRFEVRVVRPVSEFQTLVPAALQKEISIYEYVPHQRLSEMTLPGDRREAARVIVESELEAIFSKGHFDPDGHPGNWLVDPVRGRITRIDYAQLRHVPINEREAFKKTMATLIEERPSPSKIQRMIPDLFEVLDLGRLSSAEVSKVVTEAFRDPHFPSPFKPEERILFLRNRLDQRAIELGFSGVRIRENARAGLAALSKIMIYRNEMGHLDFDLKLASALGVFEGRPLLRIAAGAMQRCRPGGVLRNALENLLRKR